MLPRSEKRSSSPTFCATSTRTWSGGRIYLPADELAVHGVDRGVLAWCHAHRRTDARVRRALAEQHASHPARSTGCARPGVAAVGTTVAAVLSPRLTLYSEILDRIEDSRLRRVQPARQRRHRRRLQVAGGGLVKAWAARARGVRT